MPSESHMRKFSTQYTVDFGRRLIKRKRYALDREWVEGPGENWCVEHVKSEQRITFVELTAFVLLAMMFSIIAFGVACLVS